MASATWCGILWELTLKLPHYKDVKDEDWGWQQTLSNYADRDKFKWINLHCWELWRIHVFVRNFQERGYRGPTAIDPPEVWGPNEPVRLRFTSIEEPISLPKGNP